MTTLESVDIIQSKTPSTGMIRLTHLIYALHAISAFAGIVGAATVIGMFVFGWPSLIAVILNYVERNNVRGTWLESHFRWQIRTFWFTAAWGLLSFILFVTLIGIVVALPLIFIVGVWVVYRVIRGWLQLISQQPIAVAS
ncbi:MAG: hypothetical protein SGJ02_06540 [bacterium]|nr:hypothetical protein [bacterium]